MLKFIFFILPLISLFGCDNDSRKTTPILFEGSTMGTYYKVTLLPNNHVGEFFFNPPLNKSKFHELIKSELKIVNDISSTYISNSEISIFNDLNADRCFYGSEDFLFLVSESIRMNNFTQGFFNPLVGPLVNLWGFGPEKTVNHTLPDLNVINKLISLINIENISINHEDGTLCKLDEIYLDLSGIAKGYAVDRVSKLLKSIGANNFLVDIGGELYAYGKNQNLDPWRLAIESPAQNGQPIQTIVSLPKGGIATSGDYRNFITIENERYSHLINPNTGFPTKNPLSSVTVIHHSTYIADALATALLVMGFEDAKEFASNNKLAVYLIKSNTNNTIDYDRDKLFSWYSEEFKYFLTFN